MLRRRTSQERAYDAALAIEAHHGKQPWEPTEDKIIDLLTDLRHYCASFGEGNNLNFDDCLRRSKDHFTAEQQEERHG